jgi:nucleotide-binding universal stress UspA family protein
MAATNSPESVTRTETEAPPATASPLDEHAPPTASRGRRSGRATTALILGIISIPAAVIPIAAWILGITAIVLGATARGDIRRSGLLGSGQATAGIVCGVIGLIAGVGVFVVNISMAT